MTIPQWILYDSITGIITINTGAKNEHGIKVHRLDSYGSICEKIVVEKNGIVSIDTSNWTDGVWFIRVEKKQEVQLKRILIKK